MNQDRRVALLALLVAPAVVLGSLHGPSTARSFPIYPPLIPNRAFATASDGTQKACISCHNNADGGLGCIASGGPTLCLNPFGQAFRQNARVWTSSLAMLDSDGDGFSNGQELQDPAGTWVLGQASPGYTSYVTRPGFSDSSPGHHDEDRDGYCWFGVDLNSDGDCLDANEKTNDFDCDDTKSNVRPGSAELCTDLIDNDCNGLETVLDPACEDVVDGDGDGYCPTGRDLNADRLCSGTGENTGDVDCDPTNVLVNPGAYESCIDTVDNDCDGDTDTADSQCNGDADADDDGYCPIGQDTNDDGDCLDAGESVLPSDCDDRSNAISPAAFEVCGDAADNDCDGLADFDDSDCDSLEDGDGDRHCPNGFDGNGDGNCAGAAGTGDLSGPGQPFDCDDANAAIYSAAEEICTDTVDQDCDGQPALTDPNCAGFLDADGDRFCSAGGRDLDGNGNCIANNEMTPDYDCDDTKASVSPTAPEICTNGIDDNCNGVADAMGVVADPACANYADLDRDGFCVLGSDLNGDNDCADEGEQTGEVDLAPKDPTISPGAGESCFDTRDNDQDGLVDLDDPDCVSTQDADGDGYCPVGRDLNGDADCLDEGEHYGVSDCRDDDDQVGPHMTEVYVPDLLLQRCFDFQDNDCDGAVDLMDQDCQYLYDRDGDGVCGHGVDDNRDEDCLDNQEQRFGVDCDDGDAMRSSARFEICTDGIDNDCDGAIDAADLNCRCQIDSQCSGAGVCQYNKCLNNVCVILPNTDCGDGGTSGGGGGCSVSPVREGGRGVPAAIFAGLGLLAVVVRRTVRRRV